MNNRNIRLMNFIFYENGSEVCAFLNDITRNKSFGHEIWTELKSYFNGSCLPKINFDPKQYQTSIPTLNDNNIRIVILDKEDITSKISVVSKPSHIILLHTESTDLSKVDLASFSYCKLVKTSQEIEDICLAVYFDIMLYYINNLDKEFGGNNNFLFNQLKMQYIKTYLFGSHLTTQKYDSLFAYAEGENLQQKVQHGCKIWSNFVNWLKYNKPNYNRPNIDVNQEVIYKTINDINNIDQLNTIINDIYQNNKYAGQISRAKLVKELQSNYIYPCYLVRTIRKPKRTAQRKKLATLMSKKDFKCGLIKIVSQRNIIRYYDFERYIDIYKLL